MINSINYQNNIKKIKILIIGGVAAGTSAASKDRRINPTADIKIIQQEPLVSYGSCGMPYVIEGLIDDFSKLIARSAEEFKNKYNIDIITNTIAKKIDPLKKQVHGQDLQNTEEKIFDYDSLIIATGARAIVPKIKGIVDNENLNPVENLFLLRNFEDGIKIQSFLKNIKSANIVGSGLIGIEMAEAFKKREIKVTLVEMADHVLPNLLDKDMAKMVEEELKDNGVDVILNEKVIEILFLPPSSSKESINVSTKGQKFVNGLKTDKREILADCILLGVGVKPNSEIAKDTGIELGIRNAIKVDKYMRTSIPNIFAAGDCAVVKNYVTNKDDYLPLGTTANKQWKVAGENAAVTAVTFDSKSNPKYKAKFEGISASAITKTFGLFVGKTGISNTEEALKNGFDPIETTIEDITRAGYYPQNKKIWIKLVADKKSKRILDAQIIGGGEVKGRIDLISFALLKKATVEDLANYDACYVPPVSPVWEPVNIAAIQLLKLLGG